MFLFFSKENLVFQKKNNFVFEKVLFHRYLYTLTQLSYADICQAQYTQIQYVEGLVNKPYLYEGLDLLKVQPRSQTQNRIYLFQPNINSTTCYFYFVFRTSFCFLRLYIRYIVLLVILQWKDFKVEMIIYVGRKNLAYLHFLSTSCSHSISIL